MTLAKFKRELKKLDQEQLKKMLEKRHPEYSGKLAHWDFLEATYDGGREWFDSNIHRYHKEGDKQYNDRVERAYRFNHTREVVDLVNKYIFKVDIHRKADDAPAEVNEFWKASTLRQRGITEFMKLVSGKTSTFGKIWIVVDSNKREGGGTVSEDKEAGHRVYAYFIRPQDALDMAFDETGELQWILVRETVRDDATAWSSGTVRCRYRLWTDKYWALFSQSKDGRKTSYAFEDAGEHDLGLVPVFPCDHVVVEDLYTGQSLIDDTAYLDRAVANYLSNLDAIIQDQTFSQLVIPAQAFLPGDDDQEKLLEMGTKSIFTYDATANIKPEYISPDAAQAQLILSVVKNIINEIYHSTGLAGERTKSDNSMGIDNSSGVAKAYDFERLNAMLASKANALQAAEIQLIKIVLAYHSKKAPDDIEKLVTYPTDFDVRGLYDEFEIAQSLALVDAPKMVRREQMKIVADKLFPVLKEQLLAKMRKEIDDEWLEMQELDPAAPPSPGAPKPKPVEEKRPGQVTADTE